MGSGRTVAEILQSPSDPSAWAYKRAIVGRDARKESHREEGRDARKGLGRGGGGRKARGWKENKGNIVRQWNGASARATLGYESARGD